MYKIVLLLAVVLNCLYYCHSRRSEHPHIIFVLADDLGWSDVSFHGSQDIPTPNLDMFAYDGILLSKYYTQPICTPTRGALLTGRHPIHLGLQHGVVQTPQPWGLGLEEILLPQYLKELGYKNHIIGKWHLGFFANEYTPPHRGFDSHFGYYSGRQDYWDHTINELGWGLDLRRNMDMVKTDFGQYGTDVFTEEAEQLIANHNTSEPMFLLMSHLAVHTGNSWQPLQAPWKYYEKFDYIEDDRRRTYAAMTSCMDDSFARIIEAMADKDMLENSIIVFSTDNGGASNDFQQGAGNNLPLRGLKETYWEGGMRAAGFLWSPLLVRSGYTSDHMMQVMDWLPTLLHAAGYNMSTLPENIDGLDQWEVLSNNLNDVRTEMLHNIEPVQNGWALRMGDMKLVYAEGGYTQLLPLWYGPHGPAVPTHSANGQQTKNHSQKHIPKNLLKSKLDRVLRKMNREPPKPTPFTINCGSVPENVTRNCNVSAAPCLYNIALDPCEYYNLAGDYPELVDIMMDRLKEYNATAVPVRNEGIDQASFPSHHQGFWVPWVELDRDKRDIDETT